MEEGIPVSTWQTHQINQVLREFPEVFSEIPGMAQGVQLRIITKEEVVVHMPSRPTPLALQKNIEQEVQNMLQLGVIEPSKIPWRSPSVLVPKLDGSVRFCIDFWRLNSVSTFDAYPCPM